MSNSKVRVGIVGLGGNGIAHMQPGKSEVVAPFEEGIDRYGSRLGLFGGIDTDLLCRLDPEELYELVIDHGEIFRTKAQGFALGSGNSVPEYVPVEGYMAMIKAAQELRRR